MTRQAPRWPPIGTPEWQAHAAALSAKLNSPEMRATRERLGHLGRQVAETMQRIRLKWTCAAALLAVDEGNEPKAAAILATLRTDHERAMVAYLATLTAADAKAAGDEGAAEVAAAGRRVAAMLAELTPV